MHRPKDTATLGCSDQWCIHSDHLGSATNTTGISTKTQRYYPWGARRSSEEVVTPYRFTGQREESTIGLYFYNARWYDPALGRFVQPDTIVPEPGNPQPLNRYAYTLNNPMRYTDPTGKFTEDEIMAYFGVETWDEVLKIFMSGGKLAGMWGWLAVLRAAQFGDRIAGFRELVDFPKPHPIGYSEDYVFIEYEGGIGIARDKPGYREHPFDANTWALRSTWAGFLIGGAIYERYQGYCGIRFDPDKVDWVDVGFDIASLLGLGAARWLREGSVAYGAVENAELLVGGAQFVKHSQEALTGVRPPNVVLRDIYGILPVIGVPVQLINLIVDLRPGFSVGY